MEFDKLFDKKCFVFSFFLILVFGLNLPMLNVPYTRDGIEAYVGPPIMIKDAGLNPLSFGMHPPVYYEFFALVLKVFGEGLLVGHIFSLVFTSLLLYYTYLLGRLLYNSFIGFFAALTFFISPLSFAQSGMVHIDIPFAFFSTATVYYYLRGKTLAYVILGSMLVLTKEYGVFIILGILVYRLFIEDYLLKDVYKKGVFINRIRFKDLFIYPIPVGVIILWFLISQYVHGWVFHPYIWLFKVNTIGVFPQEFLRRLHQLFFVDYHFVVTTPVIFCLLPIKKFYDKNKRLFFMILITSLIIFFVCYSIIPILHFVKGNFNLDITQIMGRNLGDLYELKFSIAYLLFLTLFICFYSRQADMFQGIKKRFHNSFNKKTLVLIICTALMILFFSFFRYGYQKRYLILVYPFFFIIGIVSLKKLTKKQPYFFIMISIILALFIIQWHDNSKPVFQTCEENMGYLDIIRTHVEMARFIEKNYKDKIILTESPQLYELQQPFGGYVTQPIKTIELGDSYTRSIKKTLPIRPKEKFDLIYFSNGGINEEQLLKTVNIYNLTLIQKFEKNGKIAYLYGKNEQANNT